MSSLVIVAIPAEDDIVWKISSEKVPHLTLMYLGEFEPDDNVQRMAEFVDHALSISEHGPFYLEVDHRGELGPDKADVLFFENGWDSKWIKSLRGQLLQQNDIRAEYEEAEAAGEQFPDWVPHLTLGYPTAPAKPVPDDRKIYSVQFDRIAVWTGNYEGPEFRLKWPERDHMEPAVAYGEIGESAVADILQHHGVKGMKWGQRKDNPGSVIEKPKSNLTRNQKIGVTAAVAGGAVAVAPAPLLGAFAGLGAVRLNKSINTAMKKDEAQNKSYRQDKAWEKSFKKDKKYADVHNGMADHMNSWLPGHNKKYDGVDLNKDPKKMKEYEDAYFKEQGASFAKSYEKVYGKSPSGKYAVSVIPGTNKVVLHNVNVDPSAFHHADDEPLMTFAVTHDETGRIIKVDPVVDSITQSALGETFIDDILEHHGVKGMRWGVTRTKVGDAGGRAAAKSASAAKTAGQTVAKGAKAAANSPAGKATAKAGKAARANVSDRRFKSRAHSNPVIVHTMNEAVLRTRNNDLPKINEKYKGQAKTSTRLQVHGNPFSKNETQKAYHKEVADAYVKRLHEVAGEQKSSTGRLKYELQPGLFSKKATPSRWRIKVVAVQHADGEGEFDVIPVLDKDGFIVDFKTESAGPPVMTHSMDEGEAFVENLMHFGVKGMRWGQRKSEPVAAETSASSHVPHGTKRKTKIKVQGGENHPATEDALKAAEARVKLHKSGPSALSNKELRGLADRLRLEQQVKELSRGEAHKFVREFVTGQGKQTLNVATGSRIQNRVRAK